MRFQALPSSPERFSGPVLFCRVLYHVICRTVQPWKDLAEPDAPGIPPLFLFLVLLVGILLCLLSIRPTRKSPALLTQKHYLSMKERIYTTMHLGPLSVVFFLCIVLMVIEVIF